MIDLIPVFVGAFFWIWGVHCLFSEGHLLEGQGDFIRDKMPKWFSKPTIGCPACMASVHGSLWFWTFGQYVLPGPVNLLTFVFWIVFCICLCGVNFILLESIYKDEGE